MIKLINILIIGLFFIGCSNNQQGNVIKTKNGTDSTNYNIKEKEAFLKGDTIVDSAYNDTLKDGKIIKRKTYHIYLDTENYSTIREVKTYETDSFGKYTLKDKLNVNYDSKGHLEYLIFNNKTYKKGDTISIFEDYDFNQGHWKLYIAAHTAHSIVNDLAVINSTDSTNSQDFYWDGLNNCTYGLYDINFDKCCVATSKLKLLKEMQDVFRFKIKGGYRSTAYFHLYLVNDNEIKYTIELFGNDNNAGVNHGIFEYMEAVDSKKIRKFIEKLQPVEYDEISNLIYQ